MKMKNPLKKLKKKWSERNDEEESLFDIIRNIIIEEFKIPGSNIKELINSNVNKTTERLDKLSAEVSAKLIELEDRSRRNNLWIDGIKEKPNETWEACEKKSKMSLRINWE